MTAHVRSDRVTSTKISETIVGFSPRDVRAPFALRCGAVIVDYMVIVAIPVAFILLSRFMGNDGAGLLNSSLNDFGWLAAVLVATVDLFILPMINGQSLGKMATGVRIVGLDGEQPRLRSIVIRQILGPILTFFTLGFNFIFAGFSSSGRGLHDLIAGTVVIYAQKSLKAE
ncbi:MAG: RDD family protein [Blastocatellia bacterium]